MIPLKLEIKNFLSYGETMQTINFADHRLICLSGKNGHGKSAILDALTWAVWGQARKEQGASKADEGLLKLGKTKMLVVLEFALGNQIYKVRREYIKTHNRPMASLEFQLLDPETNQYIALTDKTIRQTQKKIEDVIKIDFETFVNSTFLRQANSNEFSKKSPRDRKLIFAKILGLEKFDVLQQQANAKGKEKQQQISHLQAIITKNQQTVASEGTIAEKLQQLEGLQQEYQTEQHKYEKIIELYQTACLQKKLQAERFTHLTGQIKEEKNKFHEHKVQLDQVNQQCQALTQQTEQTNLQEQLIAQQKNLETQVSNLENVPDQFIKAQQTCLEHKQKKNQLELEYQHQAQAAEKQINKDLHQINSVNLELKLLIQAQKTQQNTLNQEIKRIEQQAQNINSHQEALKHFAQQASALEKGKTLYKKISLNKTKHQEKYTQISQAISQHSCPTCQQSIEPDSEHLQAMKTQQDWLEKQLHKTQRLQIWLKEYLSLLHQDHKLKEPEIAKQQEAVTLFQVSQARLEPLKNEQTQIQVELDQNQIKFENNQLVQQHLETNLGLNTKIYAQKLMQDPAYQQLEQAVLTEQNKIELLQINLATLTKLKNDLKIIQDQLSHFVDAKTRAHQLELLQEKQQNLRDKCQALTQKIAEFEQEIAQMTNAYQDGQDPELELVKFRNGSVQITQKIRQNEQAIGQCKNQEALILHCKTENTNLEKQISSHLQEIEEWQIIGQTFGKNGIQALMIEETLPDIENETNKILSTISRNQAQVFFESLKDLKSGGIKESLDIKISDASGIRPYEMYSGGEAFRIDFALRIGLSKVIAKKAGINLKTLIIDEGFGALDEDGINLLANCLYQIANDFEKIIVVSHLQSVKEIFPIHFVVEKDAHGSSIKTELRG